MPRIVVPRSDPRLPQQIFSGDQFGAQQGRALQGLGDSVARVGDRIDEMRAKRQALKEQAEISQINQELATRQADLLIEQQRMFEEGDPADEALAAAFEQKVENSFLELRAFARTEKARTFLAEREASVVSNFRVSTAAKAADLAGVQRAKEFSTAARTLSAAVVSSPSFYDEAVEQVDSALAGLLPAERVKANMQEHAALVEARVEGLILQQKPQQALAELQEGHYDRRIDGDTKARLMRAANGAVKAERDYTLGLLKLELEDDLGQIALTGNPGRWSAATVRALGGDNPVEARVLERKFDTALAVGKASATYADMPLNDILRDVQSSQEGLATAGEFKTSAAAAEAKVEAARRIVSAYAQDPAAAVQQRSESAARAFEQFRNNPSPETFGRYATIAEAQYKRDGVDAVSVLPKAYSEFAKSRLALTGGQGDSERAARFAGELAEATGKWWPKVARDLMDGGALTREQFVAANLVQKRPSLAREVFDVSAMKDEDLKKLAPSAATRLSASQQAQAALAPFTASLPPRDLEVAGGYAETLSRLILLRQARGERVDAKKLAKEMVLDEYSFRGTTRIPKQYDANAIKRALTEERAALRREDLVSPGGRGLYAERIRAAGTWITSPDETGALLVDEVGNRVFERGPDGQPRPVLRTWEQLLNKEPEANPVARIDTLR